MNYFLGLVVVLVCVGGYFEYSQQDQRIKADEQRFVEKDAQLASLRADLDQLIQDKRDLATQLAAAKTGAPAPKPASATPAPASAPVAVTTPAAPPTPPAPATPPASPVPAPAAAPVAAAPAPAAGAPAKTSADQVSQSIVVVKGDNAEGTGFLVKTPDGPAIITNLHVLSNNPNIKIQSPNGVPITLIGMKGATDRDLAMLLIKDGAYTYLPTATDVSKTAQTSDEVLTPGNSQGGDVVLNTKGALMGLGPDRVEFSNPIYHGNSGGPVFHTKSGSVIGVVTEAMKVDMSNDLDKTSFASRNSAISASMRYFGLRLDTVPQWEIYDPRQYQNETAFIEDFNSQSERLDSYLNSSSGNNNGGQASSDTTKPYESDEKIMTASRNFRQTLNGGDTSSRIEALRQLSFDLDGIADKGMVMMKNSNNFYTFDRTRAKDALAYRQALKKEIADFSNDITRISSLPRTNN